MPMAATCARRAGFSDNQHNWATRAREVDRRAAGLSSISELAKRAPTTAANDDRILGQSLGVCLSVHGELPAGLTRQWRGRRGWL